MSASKRSFGKWNQKAVQYLDRMGRLKLWGGLLAHQAIHDTQQEVQKNRNAESAAVRRQLWDTDESEDEMGNQQTILGDVTNPAPVVISGSSTLGPLLAALLGAAIPGAGLIGYILHQTQIEESVNIEQRHDPPKVQIQLRRIEDDLP